VGNGNLNKSVTFGPPLNCGAVLSGSARPSLSRAPEGGHTRLSPPFMAEPKKKKKSVL